MTHQEILAPFDPREAMTSDVATDCVCGRQSLHRPLAHRESQSQREKVTLNAAPDGVLWVDSSGHILMSNPAMEALSGYTSAELLGQHVTIFLPEHLRGQHAQSMQNFFTAPHSRAMGEMDMKLLRRGGQLTPVDISLGHWNDDGARYAIAYMSDLPERKRFEESLQHRATHHELTYAFYSPEMNQHVHENMQLQTRLKEAIAQGRLQLHYQPQVGVESGEIVGAEALLRWHDPLLGSVSPARFIPVAEASGLILPISDWVLETACEQIAVWIAAGTPLRVAINVSAQQFRQTGFSEKIRAALARTGAQAQWLDLEITESVAMTQPEKVREQLNALVALGCRVVLDDFGTGYSSLAYLKALPVSKLKIDKSFLDGIPGDAGDATISLAIITLAHSLGMTLVAEGVETDAQLAFLLRAECEIYQGWLYAKAMKAEDLTALLSPFSSTN